MSHNFRGINHYTMNLWKFRVYSIIPCKKSRSICDRLPNNNLGAKTTKVHSKTKILSFGILTKICFICLKYIYLKIRYLLISVNIIYTNETGFQYDTTWQDTSPWVTPFCHFGLMLKLLFGNRYQMLRVASNELLNTYQILTDSQCNDGYPGRCEKF